MSDNMSDTEIDAWNESAWREDEPDYRKHLVISCNRMCKLVEINAPEFMLIAELELINTRALRLIKNEILATTANRKVSRQ